MVALRVLGHLVGGAILVTYWTMLVVVGLSLFAMLLIVSSVIDLVRFAADDEQWRGGIPRTGTASDVLAWVNRKIQALSR